MLAIEARNQRDVSMADLARLVGLPPGQSIEPIAVLDSTAPGAGAPGTSVPGLDALVATARESRDERRALGPARVARGPSRMLIMSPGTNWMMTNRNRIAPARVSRAAARRCAM